MHIALILFSTLQSVARAAVGGGYPINFTPDMTKEDRRIVFDKRANVIYKKVVSEQQTRRLPGPPPDDAATSTHDRAAALLGTVGYTTVSGTDPYTTSIVAPIGTTIAGPFEAGFDEIIDDLLSWLGCDPPSLGYLDGGMNTQTSLEAVAHQCNASLPKVVGGEFISLMWSMGMHSPPNTDGCTSPPGGIDGYAACDDPSYHFHQNFTQLYSLAAEGHSTQIGESAPTAVDVMPLYGMFEDTNKLPLLDACGGHYGYTPDSLTTSVYHHHVQERAPFAFGCFGPNDDGSLVTVQQ